MFHIISKESYLSNFEQHDAGRGRHSFRSLPSEKLPGEWDIAKIEEIMISHINIQFTLCQLFRLEYGNRIDPDASSILGFMDEEGAGEELSLFRKLFSNVFLVERSGEYLYCQVKQPYPLVTAAFEEMRKKGTLHPWILNLCLKESIFDESCSENLFYKWENTEKSVQKPDPEDTVFLDYILHNKKNEAASGLAVSGLSLEELNSSPFISQLGGLVDQMFLSCGMLKGKPYKTLDWVL